VSVTVSRSTTRYCARFIGHSREGGDVDAEEPRDPRAAPLVAVARGAAGELAAARRAGVVGDGVEVGERLLGLDDEDEQSAGVGEDGRLARRRRSRYTCMGRGPSSRRVAIKSPRRCCSHVVAQRATFSEGVIMMITLRPAARRRR